MPTYTLRRQQVVPRPLEEVFEKLVQRREPAEHYAAVAELPNYSPGPIDIRPGTLLDYRLKWHGFPMKWRTEIVTWNPPRAFTDVQIRGPYRSWHHTHSFSAEPGGTRMVDVVNDELPLGILGAIARNSREARYLEGVFEYRRQVIASLSSAVGELQGPLIQPP